MRNLEVIVRLKIRPGQTGGVQAPVGRDPAAHPREGRPHASLRLVHQPGWDGGQVHELFPDEAGLIEHKMNTMEANAALFKQYAYDHHATIYGEVSQDFINLATERMGAPTVFAFIQGLRAPAAA